jgi:glycosyltransferase involved in cell wall biosynthesis
MSLQANISPPAALPIAAVVLTLNEEKNVEACLRSVAGWCREIFVVDSGSTDRTGEICRRYTDRIFSHPFEDHPSQWSWALQNLPLTCDWVLPLDADHVVSEELRQAMAQALLNPRPGVNGYYARHRYFFWGVPMRGFKSHSVCLFRRSRTQLDFGELVDHRFVIQGETAQLRGDVCETNENEWDIDVWIDKHQKYATRMAIQEVLSQAGEIDHSLTPSLWGSPEARMVWIKSRWSKLPLFFRPGAYFMYRYFLRLGFLDGKVGLVYHFLHAFWFRFLVDLKIAALRRQLARGELSLEALKESYLGKRG